MNYKKKTKIMSNQNDKLWNEWIQHNVNDISTQIAKHKYGQHTTK